MSATLGTIALLAILTVVYAAEAYSHLRSLRRIPLRIHVNGIRGKSSVTRLIAAGLRAGGLRTVAKTTGTKPRFIFPDGAEVPVVRPGKANIIEQVRIVRRTAQLEAEALVVECMAIKPELQALLEDRIIQSTHSVITNARADHLDEMGPTVDDVARNLASTVCYNGEFFTADKEHEKVFRAVAEKRGSQSTLTMPSPQVEKALNKFSYVEHADNVALALAVCRSLGVEESTALQGMISMQPDPGALRLIEVNPSGKRIIFVNGFAINDPDSYVVAWNRLTALLPNERHVVGLAVCRQDRVQRSEQIGELLAKRISVDSCVVAGEGTDVLAASFAKHNANECPITNLGHVQPKDVYDHLCTSAESKPLVVYGVGNIVGYGEQIVELFEEESLRDVIEAESNGHVENSAQENDRVAAKVGTGEPIVH